MTGKEIKYFTLNNGAKLTAVGFGTWDVPGEAGKKPALRNFPHRRSDGVPYLFP